MLDSGEATDAERVIDYTRETVHGATEADSPVLIEAPPNSTKSTSSYELAQVAETPITYLASRIDLYEQAKSWAEDQSDIRAEEIPSPQRFCDTFGGDVSGEQAKAKQLYSKGMSGMRIHYHDDVYTPCHSEEDDDECEYVEKYETVEAGLEEGTIDLLIGNHKHAQNQKYIEDRIVVFDEFNPDPFIERFPSENELVVSDHPGDMVSDFLNEVANQEYPFPNETYQDVSDILIHRQDQEALEAALEWFEKHGVTRQAVKDYEFYEVSTWKYDSAHLLAPLLTLSLLCMRKVGKGVDLAPPPSGYEVPRIREAWENSGLHENVRCVRNRNTGEVFVLQSPDLTAAKQVIGLDGLPSKRLWDLIFSPDEKFDHRKVIRREDFSRYLFGALNMTVKQVGDGRFPYAGARVSSLDEYRFAAIKALEGQRFALISTKKAFEEYETRQWIDPFVKSAPDTVKDRHLAMMNYGSVLSSNAFEKEDLGVVAGSPFPGYQVIRIWAGLCGEEVIFPDENESRSFEGVAKEVRHHFDEHQVIQAMLRFGRHEEVYTGDGSTVYVITKALPEWFDPHDEVTIEKDTKRTSLIEFLIHADRTEDKLPLAEQNAASIKENLDESIDKSHIHRTMSELYDAGFVIRSDKGKGVLYQWDGDEYLHELDGVSDHSHMLNVGNRIYLLSL